MEGYHLARLLPHSDNLEQGIIGRGRAGVYFPGLLKVPVYSEGSRVESNSAMKSDIKRARWSSSKSCRVNFLDQGCLKYQEAGTRHSEMATRPWPNWESTNHEFLQPPTSSEKLEATRHTQNFTTETRIGKRHYSNPVTLCPNASR